jgi:CheY-like chemotaxis protein
MGKSTESRVVLIIDDDADWQDILSQTLSPFYTIRAVTNGSDGLSLARRTRPDLIILDVMMPGGPDGFTTLCKLRKDASTSRIPVIMLSAVNAIADTSFDREELERYLGVAPSIFLEKPVMINRLIEEINRLLPKPGA